MNGFDKQQYFTRYFSSSYTQKYLLHNYNKIIFAESEKYSFQNAFSFISLIENGLLHIKQSHLSPVQLKPVLLYYGCVHLLKACILTVDPHYPESTAVLAHGVSTRKKKKQHYEFLNDEVKIQRQGLFSHLATKLFHMEHLDGEKFSMSSLLKEIPELNKSFITLKNKKTAFNVIIHEENQTIALPEDILDHYHMTEQRFQQYMYQNYSLRSTESHHSAKELTFSYPPDTFTYRSLCLPFRFNFETHTYSFSMQKESKSQALPDLLILYLILYNLSMIARYETEWWSDLFKSMPHYDLPFIQSFLHVAETKIPNLVADLLNRDKH